MPFFMRFHMNLLMLEERKKKKKERGRQVAGKQGRQKLQKGRKRQKRLRSMVRVQRQKTTTENLSLGTEYGICVMHGEGRWGIL